MCSLLSSSAPVVVAELSLGSAGVDLSEIAPYSTAILDLVPGHDSELWFESGRARLTASYDAARGWVQLHVADGITTTRHRSRRHGRVASTPTRLAVTLTGSWLTAWVEEADSWLARARVDLSSRVPTRDREWLARLRAGAEGVGGRLCAGPFGQLGLRDTRWVTTREGRALSEDGRRWFSATSAGPGFFDTGHTSLWTLDERTLQIDHQADLFFERPESAGVFGDHATHVLRDGGRWLVATSTWGDFTRAGPDATVRITLAETTVDVRQGRHLLPTRWLALPAAEPSVGVWDPHLVHDGREWLVGYVSAERFFRFHPAVATGPDLHALTARAEAGSRTATEGTTIVPTEAGWWVLASDGPGGRRGQRARFPVFDLDLVEQGELSAPYPTNLPWPSLAETPAGWLLLAFDGTPAGGPLLPYGTHGDLVIMRGRRTNEEGRASHQA